MALAAEDAKLWVVEVVAVEAGGRSTAAVAAPWPAAGCSTGVSLVEAGLELRA